MKEDFNEVVLKFGVSVLIVGCLLLVTLILIFLIAFSKRRIQQNIQRHVAVRQFNYDNQVDILEGEDQPAGVARNGVLVISADCPDNPKERLSTSDRPHGYEATSMAQYVQRHGLPQAII